MNVFPGLDTKAAQTRITADRRVNRADVHSDGQPHVVSVIRNIPGAVTEL